ncbi:hypothetical protein AAY473_002416 [Plecturocebus cupreus]
MSTTLLHSGADVENRERPGSGNRSLRLAWATQQNPISTKITKISRAWRQTSVIPATGESEAGESSEPRKVEAAMREIQDGRLATAQECSSQ